MTILSRCALIAAIAAASFVPSAFAQSDPAWYGPGVTAADDAGHYGGYDYRHYAPELTGGGDIGHNIMNITPY
jgi:hypothetical protein